MNESALDRANAALARLVSGYRGGEKFAAAIAAGDVCSRRDAAERRRICKACPCKVDASFLGLVPSSWCGPPLEDRTHPDYGSARTCGCLLLGKTLVASEECPQGLWLAVRARSRGEGDARLRVATSAPGCGVDAEEGLPGKPPRQCSTSRLSDSPSKEATP